MESPRTTMAPASLRGLIFWLLVAPMVSTAQSPVPEWKLGPVNLVGSELPAKIGGLWREYDSIYPPGSFRRPFWFKESLWVDGRRVRLCLLSYRLKGHASRADAPRGWRSRLALMPGASGSCRERGSGAVMRNGGYLEPGQWLPRLFPDTHLKLLAPHIGRFLPGLIRPAATLLGQGQTTYRYAGGAESDLRSAELRFATGTSRLTGLRYNWAGGGKMESRISQRTNARYHTATDSVQTIVEWGGGSGNAGPRLYRMVLWGRMQDGEGHHRVRLEQEAFFRDSRDTRTVEQLLSPTELGFLKQGR